MRLESIEQDILFSVLALFSRALGEREASPVLSGEGVDCDLRQRTLLEEESGWEKRRLF